MPKTQDNPTAKPDNPPTDTPEASEKPNMPKTQDNPTAKPDNPPTDTPEASEGDKAATEQLLADLEMRAQELDDREAKLDARENELKRREAELAKRAADLHRPAARVERKQVNPLLEYLAKSGTGEAKLRIISEHLERGHDLESLFEKLPSGTVEKIVEFTGFEP